MSKKFLQKDDLNESYLQQISEIEQSLFVDAWSQITITDLLKDDFHQLVFLLKNKVAVGYCLYNQVFENAEILRIATHSNYQRQGIATQLLEHIFDHLKLANVDGILLEVREDNGSAIAFYHQFGFEQIAIRKNYYQNADNSRIDALILRRLF